MSKTIELPDGTPHTFTDEELERGEAMMARLREVEASLVDDTGQTAYFRPARTSRGCLPSRGRFRPGIGGRNDAEQVGPDGQRPALRRGQAGQCAGAQAAGGGCGGLRRVAGHAPSGGQATHTDTSATCDMSQGRRDIVACDREAESGHESGQNPDTVRIDYPTVQKAPECDREAILKLADDMEVDARNGRGGEFLRFYAGEIRRCCGVTGDE